jgi:type IV pilus assembly protein PilQ
VAQAAPAQVGGRDQALKGKTLDEFLAGEMKFYGSPISIQVKDGDLRDVFNFISEESGLNLVLSDDVTGKISLKLREIPWDQALIVVMQSKQLGYLRQGNIVRIAPLKSIRAETDQTRDLIEAQKSLQPVKVKIFPISYAQSKDLVNQVQQFLTDKRGKVQSDTRTNALVVTDTADVLAKVGKIIQALDTQTPQVMIEGKVIEAKDTWSRSIGISWGVNQGAALTARNKSGVPNVSFAAVGSAPSLQVGTFGLLNDLDSLTSIIQLGESEGNTKILSSPRIVATNNQKATIQQTQEKPVQTSTTTSSGTTTAVSFKQAKLQLDVTPQITADGGIILSLNVLQEFFGSAVAVGGAAAGTTEAVPVESRQAQTTVLVKNGQTAVVGGIYSSNDTEGGDGLPFLRKIPLLGRLFGNETISKAKNELMIFLSPRILNQQEAFGSNDKSEDAITE